MTTRTHVRLWLLLLWLCNGAILAADSGDLEGGFVNPGFHEKPDWFKNSFLDLRDDVAEAAAEGKQLILFFYQDGCPYCARLLNVNFSHRSVVDKTRAAFEVIAINLWGDREITDLQGASTTEKRFAESLKVMYTPTLIFLDQQGDTLLRLNGYYPPHKFEVALDYAARQPRPQGSFRAYLAQHEARSASGIMHQSPGFLEPPLNLADRSGHEKPLLVLMEQRDCAPCDELHLDILQRPEVKASLAGFDVALVDVWSNETLTTPAGERLKAVDWATVTGIQYTPSLLFYDRQGREVFRTDAYLKAYHIHAALDYVLSGSYKEQANFQRYLQARTEALRQRGVEVDLME